MLQHGTRMVDEALRAGRPKWAEQEPLLTRYYDEEWGMPVTDETGIFERLSLETFQAGLSWLTILRRRESFREAFRDFQPTRVSEFGDTDIERLLADSTIIRNRRKIEATINNAQVTLELRHSGRSLPELVWSYMPERSPRPTTDREVPTTSPESVAMAKELKRLGFRFVGPTITYSLMCAIGIVDAHLVDSHRRGCSGLWNTDGSRTDLAPPHAEVSDR